MTDTPEKDAEKDAETAAIEKKLGRLPVQEDPAFAGRLRRRLMNIHPAAAPAMPGAPVAGGSLQEEPAMTRKQSLPSRAARKEREAGRPITQTNGAHHRPARRRRSPWPRLVWGLAAAAVLVLGGLKTQDYLAQQRAQRLEQQRLASLEKIPATVAAPVGAGGKYGKVTVSSWVMSAQFPANPKLGMVYRPTLTQYTEAEAKAIAQRLSLSGFTADTSDWRFYEGQGNEGGVGKLLMVSKTEARVMYQDYYGLLGPKPPKVLPPKTVSKDQAITLAKQFMDRGGIPYSDAFVYAEETRDAPGFWQIRFADALSSNGKDSGVRWPVAGFETWVLVEQGSGRVASVNSTRAHFLPADLYPLRSVAEAYAELQKMPFYASESPTAVTVDRVEVAYYNFPTRDRPLGQTRLQPVYRFVVHDKTGELFELKITAVQDAYVKK